MPAARPIVPPRQAGVRGASEPAAVRPSPLAGIAIVRGGGAPTVQRRLPRRAPASVGRRDRHAFDLPLEWVPKDLAVFEPVRDGWLVHNAAQVPLRVDSDWLTRGEVTFAAGAIVMLQRGDHTLAWPGLAGDLTVSVGVRTRRLEDQRIPYAVDSRVDPQGPGMGTYLGVEDAPMSAALRYKMAVLFRHLLEDAPEPSYLVRTRADFLGVSEGDLEWAAHRLRRRINVVLGTDLQSIEELGHYLVGQTGQLGPADLDP